MWQKKEKRNTHTKEKIIFIFIFFYFILFSNFGGILGWNQMIINSPRRMDRVYRGMVDWLDSLVKSIIAFYTTRFLWLLHNGLPFSPITLMNFGQMLINAIIFFFWVLYWFLYRLFLTYLFFKRIISKTDN